MEQESVEVKRANDILKDTLVFSQKNGTSKDRREARVNMVFQILKSAGCSETCEKMLRRIIHRVKLTTFETDCLLSDDFIHFCSNERIQFKTKLTPLEKRSQFAA